MSGDVDYYDVQAMIRDARSEIRGEIRNAVDELRASMLDALSAALHDAAREWAGDIRAESERIMRVVDARTGHLV